MNKITKLLSLTIAVLFITGISCEYPQEDIEEKLTQESTNKSYIVNDDTIGGSESGNKDTDSTNTPVNTDDESSNDGTSDNADSGDESGNTPALEVTPHEFNFIIKEVTIAWSASKDFEQVVRETGKPEGDKRSIIYSATPSSMATVTSAGKVKLNMKGTVTITATKTAFAGYEKKTASYVIYNQIKLVNKIELKQEIDRAISVHGNTVDLNYIDTSAVQDMSLLFYNMSAFNGKIDKWNTGAATTMSHMFDKAEAFNQDIGNWDVSAVTDMSSMFSKAKAFNQDISRWDVSAVTNMRGMFNIAKAFNQDISRWNVGAATNINFMFFQSGVTSLPAWYNTSK